MIINVIIAFTSFASALVVIYSIWNYTKSVDYYFILEMLLCTVNILAGLHRIVITFAPTNKTLIVATGGENYLVIDLLIAIISYIVYLIIRNKY